MTASTHTQSVRASTKRKTQSASLLNSALSTSTAHHRHSGHPQARSHSSTQAQHPAKSTHPAHHKEKLPPGIQYQPF
jgi:hypothetical protein